MDEYAAYQQLRRQYEDTQFAKRKTEKAARATRILYLSLIPLALVILALWDFAHAWVGTAVVLIIVAILAVALLKVYYDSPCACDDRANSMPPSIRERYTEARTKLATFLRDRSAEIGGGRAMVRRVEDWAAPYGVELTPEQAQYIALTFSNEFKHILPHHTKAVEDFLLLPLRARQESIRQVPWQVDTIQTSKGAVIVTWRPASTENMHAMQETANTTSQHLIGKMTEILTAHPDADLAKYAAHFGVEVQEVERTWTQQGDPVEAIFKQLATSATSLVQLEIQLEGVLKKYNVEPDSEVGLNIQGIYRAAAARFADPNSQ